MDGVRIEITGAEGAISQLSEAAQKLSQPQELWEAIGSAMIDSTKRRFREGAGPGGVPWKPSWRAAAGEGKTLIGHGTLMESITAEADAGGVRWGSNIHYARIHQLGGTITPKNASALVFKVGDRVIHAKSVTMPARPFLGFDAEDEIAVRGVMLDFLALAFGGAADADG